MQNLLIHSGFISSSLIILPRGRIKILKLTEKGKKVLGINTGESDRHGGPEHRYWAKRIADHLRANGYDVAKEVPVGGGKTIDIVAVRGDTRIAFEIETGRSNIAANVEKCLKAGMDKVIIIATNARAMLIANNTVPLDHRIVILRASDTINLVDLLADI